MSDTTVRHFNLADTAVISEEELLDRAQQGDKTAFGALYLRHRDAARRVAAMSASSAADAEDAVAEGFARVFAALPRLAGREISFRPYLLTAVRNAATDRLRRERRVDLRDTVPDEPATVTADDVALLGLERNLVGEALQALPSRWRTVLWLTEVEGLTPAEVSRRIGIKPNAVAALAYRARKGLREAYLQAHLRVEAAEECRATVSRLGHYVRGELAERERVALQTHLDTCPKCRSRRDELTDVNATLRSAFLPVPLLLGGLQRGWQKLFDSALWSHAPEVAQVAQAAQAAEQPLMQKTVAGIGMVVLALTGAAVPAVVDEPKPREPKVEVAAAKPGKGPAVLDVVAAKPDPAKLGVVPVAGDTTSTSSTSRPSAAASAPAEEESAAAAEAQSHSRGLLQLGSAPDEGGGRSGDTRQRLLRPPDEESEEPGGVLPGTVVGDAVSGTLDTVDDVAAGLGVDLGEAVPVGVEITTPAPSDSAEPKAPLGVEVKVSLHGIADEPAVEGDVGTITGLLEPATGLLGIKIH